jgi:predicted nucleotidyltransferase
VDGPKVLAYCVLLLRKVKVTANVEGYPPAAKDYAPRRAQCMLSLAPNTIRGKMVPMATKPSCKMGGEHYYRYLPPNIPRSAIRRFARRIAEPFDPEKIVLFGSFAYGTPHEYSDVDLLVVRRAANEINQAIRITLAFDREFPLDLIVRTPERLHRRLAEGDSFLSDIMTRGIVVYEKRNPILDKKSGRRPASLATRRRHPIR